MAVTARFSKTTVRLGYFYALDLLRTPNMILDSVHIYNVASVKDGGRPSELNISWSEDGSKCALFIIDYPHAVVDFSARKGYCRTNFPNFENRQDSDWDSSDHAWSEEAVFWLDEQSFCCRGLA